MPAFAGMTERTMDTGVRGALSRLLQKCFRSGLDTSPRAMSQYSQSHPSWCRGVEGQTRVARPGLRKLKEKIHKASFEQG